MIETTIEGTVATLRLNRPEKHNALGVSDLADFASALKTLDSDKDIRVLILTGAGDKTFCAGVALGELGADWTVNPLNTLCDQLEAFRTPVICALNGSVFGGAVDIALACDFRIGVEHSRMAVPAARLGVHFELSALRRFSSRLGHQGAKRLLIGAETLEASDMLDIGFLDALVYPRSLEDVVRQRAGAIAALAPLAVEGMKAALNGIAQETADGEAISAHITRCWTSADLQEGLAANAGKRVPVFKRQ